MDVCPLLDLMSGVANYTLHVHVETLLQLTTRHLPDTVSLSSENRILSLSIIMQVSGFTYICQIGNQQFAATRYNESSLTCHITEGSVKIECL